MPLPYELQNIEAISTAKEAFFDTAHNPLRIIGEDVNNYIIKSNHTDKFYEDHGFYNEFICGYFLKIWGITSPDFAVVNVNSGIFEGVEFPEDFKPATYEYPCFGSLEISNYNDFIYSNFDSGLSFANRFSNKIDFLKIGLFDLWVCNIDRRPSHSNLVTETRNNEEIIYPIDHYQAFDGKSYNSLHRMPTLPDSYSILRTNLLKKIYRQNKVDFGPEYWRSYYYDSVSKSEQYFGEILAIIEANVGFEITMKTDLERFLFNTNRINSVFTDFYRLLL